jgi:hypothetical protein
MAIIKNIVRGKKAKVNGQRFEIFLENSAARKMWTVTRIPDGCRQVGPNKLLRVRTPFDFVFTRWGKAVFADAKSTQTKYFSKSALTPHQIEQLKDIENDGFAAGYIVNFSTLNLVVFFSATLLSEIKTRDSVGPEQGILIGNDEVINLQLIFEDALLKGRLLELQEKKRACSPESLSAARSALSQTLESVAHDHSSNDPEKPEPD